MTVKTRAYSLLLLIISLYVPGMAFAVTYQELGKACYQSYSTGAYDQVISQCTSSIMIKDNAASRYNRGLSYNKKGQFDLALQDLRQSLSLPDSDKALRADALLNMSYVLGQQNKYPQAIDIFTKNPWLLAADMDKNDVALGYNNICFFYKEMGKYQEALDNCNKSLAIKEDPEPRYKQVELMKLLGR